MQRILIVGCGDIGRRVARRLAGHYRLLALTRSPAQQVRLRALGMTPVAGDLDRPESLRRLAGLADIVLYLAPPQAQGRDDARMRHLLSALSQSSILPQGILYISTSGVYGDCGGSWVSETRPVHPATARARRRVSAERQVRQFARRTGVAVGILRVPGIYAAGRLPRARIVAGTPAIEASSDSFSNHIHADDLAAVIVAALRRGRPGRIYHASDDVPIKMGDYFDQVADACRLPRPPRVTRAAAQALLTPVQWSFLGESRRLANDRMHKELGVRLAWPSVAAFLAGFDGVDD